MLEAVGIFKLVFCYVLYAYELTPVSLLPDKYKPR